MEVENGLAGLDVDEVAEVIGIAGERIAALPGGGDEGFVGIAEVDGRLIVVLDAERLLAAVELVATPERAAARTRGAQPGG